MMVHRAQRPGVGVGGHISTYASYAALYEVGRSGTHRWLNAASGTAGTAITFTQAMTLDSTGALLLGTTTKVSTEKFAVFGAFSVFRDASYTGYVGSGSSLSFTGAASDFALRSESNLLFTSGGGTERARLSSTGNFGLGTTTPGFILDVQGSTTNTSRINVLRTGGSGVAAQLISTGALAGVAATSAGPFTFYTSDLERARFDPAGNFGIGTNAPADLLHLSSAAPTLRLTDSDTGGYTQLSAANSTGSFGIYVDQGNTVASSIFLLYIDGAEKMRVDATGNLTATGNVTAYSDERLKTNIRTVSSPLDLETASHRFYERFAVCFGQ
jgi:hypothetical protein